MDESANHIVLRDSACDMIAQAWETLRAQEQRLAKLQQGDLKLQQSMASAAGRFSRLDTAMAELSQRGSYVATEMLAVKGRIDQGLAAQTARFEQGVAALSETLQQGLSTGTDGNVGALANRIDRLDDHIGDTDDRIGLINERIGSISDRMASIDERLSGALTPLADELRLRPGHAEAEEIVAKVVCAAQAEMTTRLDSLEETVLTLAEALLRPARRRPDQRREDDQS